MRGNFIPPLYQGPLSWLPRGWDHGDPDFLSDLLAADDIVYLAVGYPFDSTKAARGLGSPLHRKPLAWSPYFHYRGATEAVRLGDHHAYISHATDTPASHPFPAVLATAYSVEVGLGGSEQDRLGGAAISFGDTAIDNGTGEQDALINHSWGGRQIEIKAGLPDWPLSRFATALRGNVANIRAGDAGINLGLASRDGLLDNPLTRTYYAGTGGIEGPAALAGRPRRLIAGRRRSVPMLLLDQAKQIWQVAEQLGAVLEVRNRGLVIDDSGDDYLTYAALEEASVASGEYATCLAAGLIRFGSEVTVPTADVDGPPEWGDTPATIIEYLLRNRLGRFNLTASGIEGGSFNVANAERGWKAGIWLDGETTIRPVIDALVRSIGGWLLPNRRGLFQIGLYARPLTTTGTITAADVDDAGPELIGRWRAVRNINVLYQPRSQVLRDENLSSEVSEADRNLLGSEFLITDDEIRSVADRDAVDYVTASVLDEEADAVALGVILADLLSWATHRWRLPLRSLPLRYWAGDRRTFVYPRHGLSNGANFLVTRVVEGDQGDNALELWGGRP